MDLTQIQPNSDQNSNVQTDFKTDHTHYGSETEYVDDSEFSRAATKARLRNTAHLANVAGWQ